MEVVLGKKLSMRESVGCVLMFGAIILAICRIGRRRNCNMNNRVIMEMTRYYSGDPKHIQHFMKVYAYARMIGEDGRA